MNIRVDSIYQLLQAFARLEFTLLKVPRFIKGRSGKLAMVHWENVFDALAALPASEFVDLVPDSAKNKIFSGDRNRPKRQLVREPNDGPRYVEFDFDPLPVAPAEALLEATKRVRNNLFNGGKENPREQPYEGDDQEWCDAALDVLHVLLRLPWSGTDETSTQ